MYAKQVNLYCLEIVLLTDKNIPPIDYLCNYGSTVLGPMVQNGFGDGYIKHTSPAMFARRTAKQDVRRMPRMDECPHRGGGYLNSFSVG